MSRDTLESLCTINPESLDAATPPDFEFQYVDISSVSAGRVDWGQVRRLKLAESPSRARRRLRQNDVLLCTVRPGLKAHARISQENHVPLVGSTGFAVLRPNNPADSSFVFHQLFSDEVAAQLRALEMGSNYPAVNERDVRRVSVFAPGGDQRRKIAGVLDTVDAAIAKTEAVIAKLKQVRAGLLHDLLTRGLDEHDQLRDPLAHAEQFQDAPFGVFPKEWNVTRLGQFINRIDQGWSPDCDSEPAPAGEWGVLKTTAVVWDGYDDRENKRLPDSMNPLPAYEVKDGDVLITRCGPGPRVGVAALVRDTQGRLMLSDKLYRLVPCEKISAAFVVLMLSSHAVQTQLEAEKTGMAVSQTNISHSIVRNLFVAIPDPKEQAKIVATIEAHDERLRAERKELAKLVVLKSGLMSDLLTGRVRVPACILRENS